MPAAAPSRRSAREMDSSRFVRCLACFALVLAAPAAARTSGAAGQEPTPHAERESLQEFLARLRKQQAGLLAGMKGNVDTLVRALETEAQTRRIEGLDAA